jgi:hypothetical protein
MSKKIEHEKQKIKELKRGNGMFGMENLPHGQESKRNTKERIWNIRQ